jgi:hypothetical protein
MLDRARQREVAQATQTAEVSLSGLEWSWAQWQLKQALEQHLSQQVCFDFSLNQL